jgi:hypothetical protein
MALRTDAKSRFTAHQPEGTAGIVRRKDDGSGGVYPSTDPNPDFGIPAFRKRVPVDGLNAPR